MGPSPLIYNYPRTQSLTERTPSEEATDSEGIILEKKILMFISNVSSSVEDSNYTNSEGRTNREDSDEGYELEFTKIFTHFSKIYF